MNALQIIREHLERIGADGLCTNECGCGLEDLAPCEDWIGGCVPARRTVATEELLQETGNDIVDVGDEYFVALRQPTSETFCTCNWGENPPMSGAVPGTCFNCGLPVRRPT